MKERIQKERIQKERIQKVLATIGVASRRAVEQLILDGRVAVNGKVVTRLPVMIDVAADEVVVDGERVKLRKLVSRDKLYILLNKPKGVYATNVAQGEQKRAIDLLPPNLPGRVYPVGRLDAESKGLLLLTNDGDLTNQLTHARFGVPRTYRLVVDGFVLPQVMSELEKGVWLGDRGGKGFKTGRAQLRIVKKSRDRSILDITLREGANREVRRMLASAGHKVREVTRTRIGPLTLDGLSPGQSRLLSDREVRELRSFCRQRESRAS